MGRKAAKPSIGHNSGSEASDLSEKKEVSPRPTANFSADRLKSFVKRIEKLNEQRDDLGADIREVMAEAKSTGFDPKIIRRCIADRKMEAQARIERDELVALYQSVLGMDAAS